MGEKIVDGSTQFFPQEIITNILKRLPVKSLMRFQCVCKQWKNLIMAPTFIFDHLHHSSHHSPSLLFKRHGSDTILPLDLSLLDCEKQFHKVQNIPFDSSVHVKIIGSSNGLLCVKCSSNRVCSLFLWNPAIRKTRQVHSNANDFRGLLFLGYGFSPVVNDYKILRAYALEDEYGDEDEVTRVEVYSLSTDRWKEIKFGNLEGVKFECETFSADGCMFWLGSKSDGEEELVISFDIAMEAFTLIPMPPLDKSNKYFTHKLVVYENKLAVMSHFIVGVSFTTDSWYIDLWVLEEAIGAPQERWNWTKKYSLITFTDADLPSGIFRIDPLCIWRGELVCDGLQNSETVSETECEENIEGKEMFGIYGETDWEEYMNEMLGVYGEFEPQEDPGVMSALCLSNLRTNELRKIATGKCNNYYSVIFNHVESLVPIDSIRIREV